MPKPPKPVVRRWDGKLKEATIWDKFARDPELSAPDANCFIYLSSQDTQPQEAAFVVPFDRLIWSQCQPLIKKATVLERQSGGSPTASALPRSSGKDHPTPICRLFLEAPKQYNGDAVTQYHITTRNFFAWVLGKPVVGLDPASALLALKIRMDVWRTDSVDNFMALHQYAKSQGYGDLGDVQAYLSNHLRGFIAAPTGYKLLDGEEHTVAEVHKSRTNSFKGSILESAWWTQLRKSWPHSSSSSSIKTRVGSLSDMSIGAADDDRDDMVMSGAIPPAKDIKDPSTTTYLPMGIDERSAPISSSRGQRMETVQTTLSSRQASPWAEENLRPRHYSRTWSLPNLYHPARDELPSVPQSSWMSNLYKEHDQLSTPAQEAAGTQHATATPAQFDMSRTSQRQHSSVPRHRRTMSLARQPSTIMEEDLKSAMQGRSLLSGHDIPIGFGNAPSMIDSSSGIADADVAKSASEIAQTRPGSAKSMSSQPVSRPLSPGHTRQCPRSILPSHSNLVCKTCQKPRLPGQYVNQMRQQLTSRRSSLTRPLSLPTPQTLATSINVEDVGVAQSVSSSNQHVADNLTGRDDVVSRFPSLRRPGNGAKTSKTPSLPSSAGDNKDDLARRHNLVTSEAAASYSPQIERPAGKFGGRSFAGQVSTRQTTTRHVVETMPKEQGLFLASAKQSKPEANRASLSRASITSKQPQQCLRNDGFRHEADSYLPSPIRPHVEAQDQPRTSPDHSASAWDHRVPIDEQSPGAGNTKTMDIILQEITTIESHTSVRKSAQSIVRSVDKQTLEDRHAERISEAVNHGLQQTQSVAKRRLRNSLKMWNSKRLQKEMPSSAEYQGLVLCMDRFGNFSTLPSPVEGFANDMQSFPYERSRTPLCELP